MSQAAPSPLREPRDPISRPRRSGTPPSTSKDWLYSMNFAARAMAAGAELIPLPYIRAAFDAVVLFLETVEKIKKNREDLKDLCASMMEIVVLLRDEISVNGDTGAMRLKDLCENFIGCMKFLQSGLEKLQKSHQGIRGRFKEVVGATNIADGIRRYRTRLDELRSNLTLIATINTNLNVADIQKSLTAIPSPHSGAQFRHVALGDINLLCETPMTNKIHKIKIFTARISGESSIMTVAKYEDEQDKWQQDLALYSRVRHPNVWQLFGLCQAAGWQALIFYDELIPLGVYRQFHRPTSDLVWVCVEGMLFKQFKDSEQYYQWSVDHRKAMSTICVRRDPVQLALSVPDGKGSSALDPVDKPVHMWYSGYYRFHHPDGFVVPLVGTCPYPHLRETLIQRLGFKEFYHTLIAPWGSTEAIPFGSQGHYHLGSILEDLDKNHSSGRPLPPLGFVPHSFKVRIDDWSTESQRKFDRTDKLNVEPRTSWKRITFAPGSFNQGLNPGRTSLVASIKLDPPQVRILHEAWLSQANTILPGKRGNEGNRFGVIDMISYQLLFDTGFKHVLRNHGTTVESHLFLCPLHLRTNDTRFSLGLAEAGHYYWSMDPTGTTRLSPEDSDTLGLPRFRFEFRAWGTFWELYHYNAVREFHQAKGFDPDSLDVTQLLGLPVVHTEDEISCTGILPPG
ncbi:hypothetical protein FB451DRAFT_1307514 [Mycena latifolia]|nr:hypothetical protein FB451DRAFT_1307514 [Mycena latifolia]